MQLILFDLEATCWKNLDLGREQEIIEIGAIKVNQFGEEVDLFQSFVRPELYPRLSYYCMELTGISQKSVDRADPFDAVFMQFMHWTGLEDMDVIFASWGSTDLDFLMSACRNYDLDISWLGRYIDLKEQYTRIQGLKKGIGLKKALSREGEEFEGSPHRALDDASNLLPIFVRHIDEWIY